MDFRKFLNFQWGEQKSRGFYYETIFFMRLKFQKSNGLMDFYRLFVHVINEKMILL
jgi:hypothetical protein